MGTYKINIPTVDDGQPEELPSLLRNFKIAINGNGTTKAPVRINYLRTMLHGKSLREFDERALSVNFTDNHLKHITEGLLEYFPPLNEISKYKRAMRREMCKPCHIIFKRFTAQLTEINNFIPLFPGSDASNNMPPEEFNEILLHEVTNG